MQAKRTTKQLVFEATFELLQETELSHVSVRGIAQRAGITTRSFYNYFPDKYAVVNQIYTEHMAQYVGATLTEWTEQRSDFFMKNSDYFRNAVYYSGQNSLSGTIVSMEYDKYELHINLSVDRSSLKMKEIRQGIIYTVNGQMGLFKSMLRGNIPVTHDEYQQNYANVWDLMSRWTPAIVLDNLNLTPVYKEIRWDRNLERIVFATSNSLTHC
jgi:AcrR family transcriptional regulator